MKTHPTLSEKQTEFLDWEFGMFFHFGIRSFYPGHVDWDGREMPLSGFCPTSLDCFDWTETARRAGAKYAILTAKHHDGFALWPSAYTEYSVKNTPWKNGKGDVVAEFVAACRRSGLKVGLYYSPAQWGNSAVSFENAKEYDDYFISQVGELLTNYGKIDYLWFDGCGSENHEYDKARIVREIRRLQPGILTFCTAEWDPSVRWVGNEDGYASKENPLAVMSAPISERTNRVENFPEEAFLPAECDCQIRNAWFYDHNEDSLKSVEELFGMYEMSVGNGSNFLLNIGPDPRGLLPEKDKERVLALGERIRKVYGSPCAFSAPEREENGDYCITAPCLSPSLKKHSAIRETSGLINRVVLSEDLSEGQAARAFRLYFCPARYKNCKLLLYKGATVGHKVICQIPTVRASKLILEVTESDGDFRLADMKTYYTGDLS